MSEFSYVLSTEIFFFAPRAPSFKFNPADFRQVATTPPPPPPPGPVVSLAVPITFDFFWTPALPDYVPGMARTTILSLAFLLPAQRSIPNSPGAPPSLLSTPLVPV